jgi:hypothetical protein
MKTNLQTSKSILAKLLASENITVSHQNVRTAYFDLKNRTMTLPVWQDMDGDLYDLLTGHEVGHALNTPEGGWHDQVKQSDKKFKDFLNVIEDARIEKLVKRKFPGLSKSFASAYKSLYERDFFGIQKLDDLNKLNLIDRINLRFKMGAHVVVEFNDFERDIVREVEAAETWDQVVDIARRVYDYVKQNEQDKIQNKQDLREQMEDQNDQQDDSFGDGSEEQEDQDFEDDSDDSELDDESDGEESDSGESQESDDEAEDADGESSTTGGNADEDEDDDEPQSVTDRSFRQREQELVNQSGKVFMYNLPETNLDKIILPNKEVMADLEKFIRQQVARPISLYSQHRISYDAVVQKCVRKFNKNNKKVIMHILKEFEMRKRASEYARAQIARTGELNMNVLHKYKFSNDLFRKITVVPKGKNHGFVMFVDMSGSMADIFRNTIEQMLILASFCKLAKVPFDVYGFSDDDYCNPFVLSHRSHQKFVSDSLTEIAVDANYFHLKHLIGSSLSPSQYRHSFNMLCVVANEFYRGGYRDNSTDNDHGSFDYNWADGGFGLNGTPFVQTLLASRDIITRFQNKNQLDVCNVIYLTDGCGGEALNFPPSLTWDDRRNSVVYVVDKKSKKKIKLGRNYQQSITELVGDITGCKHIGFYVSHTKMMKRDFKYTTCGLSYEKVEQAKKTLRESNYYVVPQIGYDKYFFVGLPSSNIVDDKLNITSDMNKGKMAREFSKNLDSKRTNRLLLTKIAEELAVA